MRIVGRMYTWQGTEEQHGQATCSSSRAAHSHLHLISLKVSCLQDVHLAGTGDNLDKDTWDLS